jgi:hypothetical protein
VQVRNGISFIAWLAVIAFLVGCTKDASTTCADNDATASFNVNSAEFSALQEKRWLRSGTQHSLQFMQQMPNGDQHVVIVIFNGDTVGNYPLLGINGTHRLSYFAPGINATTFEAVVVPGVLEITNFDEEPGCLSGRYTFEVDTLEISGEFQSLRTD